MRFCFFICCFIPLLGQAQNLTGTWVGHSGIYYVKLVVIHKGDSLVGYTYDKGIGWCQASFLGIYNKDQKSLKGKGVRMLKQSGGHAMGDYQLHYSSSAELEELNGTVQPKSMIAKILSFGLSSRIFLKKETNGVDTIAFMQSFIVNKEIADSQKFATPDTGVLQNDTQRLAIKAQTYSSIAQEKSVRVSKILETIYTDSDSLKIALYDNGEVDQDSVSLFFDNAIILNRYMISDKPIELTLLFPKDGKEHTLDLFAHNLGKIPPNTALIIITLGKKRYELRASYDLNSNARIIFSQRPPIQ